MFLFQPITDCFENGEELSVGEYTMEYHHFEEFLIEFRGFFSHPS